MYVLEHGNIIVETTKTACCQALSLIPFGLFHEILPRNISWVGSRTAGMVTLQLYNGKTYAITVFQHCNNLTTPPPISPSNHNKLTMHILIFCSKMPLQINIIKGEQCILYKYFKSIELSLIYVYIKWLNGENVIFFFLSN